ncbi:MAG: hypothetical protein JXB88_01415 [Spirochaetales bacterium]|nr:hypothetical protein [Spirochaetales bacterium]
MIKNERIRMWVNRIVAFLAGALILFIFLQSTVVSVTEDRNKELVKQLDEIRYEPGRLLNEGKTYFEKNEYDNAKGILNTLFGKHPVSEETAQGKTLYAKIEKLQEEMDKKWEAAVKSIREEWTKKMVTQLKKKLETEREDLIKNMDSNLDKEWEKVKDGIRKEWEKQI